MSAKQFNVMVNSQSGLLGVSETSRISVHVIQKDEEWMIATMVCRVFGLTIEKEHDHEEGI